MNSPYKGKFRVTQQFKGTAHDGLDLVGVDSKEIHSTVNGVVEKAGWENSLNHKQGFGRYVRIKEDNGVDRYYFGHLSEIKVRTGQAVKIGDVIGIEGSTGKSSGSHCHYCVRGNASRSQIRDINAISGIPNAIGTYNVGSSANITAGWKKDNNGWWYQNEDGTYPKNQWLQLDAWYWFDEKGYAVCNSWKQINNHWYWFGEDCRMVTGLKEIGGALYYFAEDGHMCRTNSGGALE